MTIEIIVGIVCLAAGIILRPFLEDASKWFYSKVKGIPLEEENKVARTLKEDSQILKKILSHYLHLKNYPKSPDMSHALIKIKLESIYNEAQKLESKKMNGILKKLSLSSIATLNELHINMNSKEKQKLLVPESKAMIKEICGVLGLNPNDILK